MVSNVFNCDSIEWFMIGNRGNLIKEAIWCLHGFVYVGMLVLMNWMNLFGVGGDGVFDFHHFITILNSSGRLEIFTAFSDNKFVPSSFLIQLVQRVSYF